MGICSFAEGEFSECGLDNTFTITGANSFILTDCYHEEDGAPSTIDFGSAVGATEVHIHGWKGNLLVINMGSGDILHFSSAEGTLELDNTNDGGTANLTGTFKFTNGSSGMTINNNGQAITDIAAVKSDTAATLIDTTEIGTAGAGLSNINLPNQTMDIIGNITGNLSGSVGSLTGHTNQTANHTAGIADIPTVAEFNARTIVSASYFDPTADAVANVTLTATTTAVTNEVTADLTAISGDATASDRLEALMEGTLVFQVNAGSPNTTSMVVDGDVNDNTDDHYIGRLITGRTGANAGQQTAVTDWDGTTKLLTFEALTGASADDDFWVMT